MTRKQKKIIAHFFGSQNPICNNCGGVSKKSKAFGDAKLILTDSTTLEPNGYIETLKGKGGLIKCWKCENCGRSWT